MKRTRVWMFLAAMGVALGSTLGVSCGRVGLEAVGGETHWLQPCGSAGSGAAECGANLECVCGVCTIACTVDSSCVNLSDGARCATRAATPYAGSCQSGAPERLCVRSTDLSTNTDDDVVPELPSCTETVEGCLAPDAGTPREEEEEPEPPGCVETVRGCLECAEARQSLVGDARALVQREGYDICSSDDDCSVLVNGASFCERQCDIPINNALYEVSAPALEALAVDYCPDPNQWQTTCGEPNLNCTIGYNILCRAGRCVSTDTQTCADRTLAACEVDGECALSTAFSFDPAGQCFSEARTSMGCVAADVSCPPVLTPALDGNGNCFLFGDCLPAGFERAPAEHDCNAAIATTCSN